ncbi:putative RTA1 domain protein [Talaromyces proteolyticus]|uniref:RTA1 domain protein n=1 Tax=Talaromyces proteolyticus TaxID=1131652 RepID=A0AAD4KKR5_9EURO|nr:putative RTA1 domain protein [Talaromyces proteolyticus]KAH8693897.1 putative RTA1 domain protein [Talaromyces proteolyticus]
MSSHLSYPAKIPACLPYNPNIPTPFGYRPSLPAGVVFMVLFAGLSAAHIWHAWRRKSLWIGLAFSLGAFGEFGGWLARTVAYRCPYSIQMLEMQLALLTMAPAFTTAGIYGILGLMIPIIGQDKSPLSPKLYLTIFMTVDFFSLLLQAVGGGLAGAAFSKNMSPWPGTYTIVAGIIWQLASTCVFATLLEYVIFRGRNRILQNPALRLTSLATMIAVTCMVARGVYRSMELMNGWRGYLFTHEAYAIVLDAGLMFIASLVFVIWHPAILIPQAKEYVSRRPLAQEVLELRQSGK